MCWLADVCIFQYKDKISEAELTEITSKQGQAAVHKLDKLFDKAEVLPRSFLLTLNAIGQSQQKLSSFLVCWNV